RRRRSQRCANRFAIIIARKARSPPIGPHHGAHGFVTKSSLQRSAAMEDPFHNMPEAHLKPLGGLPSRPALAASASGQDPAWVLSRAETMFGCYRKDDATNPEVYCAAISAVLS